MLPATLYTLRQAWLISGALNVRRIFSAVQYNVLAVIDSVAIAIIVSNPGEWIEFNQYSIMITDRDALFGDLICTSHAATMSYM